MTTHEHHLTAHKAARSAADDLRHIRFTPEYPCYHCGEPATVAAIYQFQFMPVCQECVEKLIGLYSSGPTDDTGPGEKTP